MAHIQQPKAPNLVLPSLEYDRSQQGQMQNQLRLYFNQLDSNNNAVKSSIDGLITLQWLGDN